MYTVKKLPKCFYTNNKNCEKLVYSVENFNTHEHRLISHQNFRKTQKIATINTTTSNSFHVSQKKKISPMFSLTSVFFFK